MKKKLSRIWDELKNGKWKVMIRRMLWIFQYAKHYFWAIVFYTMLGLSGIALSLLSSLVSKNLVDIVTGKETGQVVQTFCIMIGMSIGSTFVTQITTYISSKINMKVDADIKADIFSKILVTDWESLSNYHTGDLITRWGDDASIISSSILNFFPNLVVYIVRFLSALVMMAYYDFSFAGIVLLSMPFSYLITRALMQKMRKNNMNSAAMNAKVSGFNQETFSNIQTIKAFDMIPLYLERLKQLQKEFIDLRLSFQRISILISILMTIVGMMVSYISYGWGIYRVWSGAITYGTMTMFLGLSATLTTTMNNLISLVPSSVSITIAAGRLMDIVEMPREDFSQRDEIKAFYDRHKNEGVGIELKDVTYAYRNGTKVFDHASLHAKPHEVIALVGPSGEGKTTMLRLLLSLVLAQEGDAWILAGEEKMALNASARQLISYVPQGNTMFSGTIADNMRNVKPDASDEEIIHALELACAWHFVEKLPEGINSPIKERGGGFSEGQAQRLSIARAILRQSPILLLDEATSALDVATERKLLGNIMKDEYPRTCIVTTHRPTVLKACTRVYAIRDMRCKILSDEEISQLM